MGKIAGVLFIAAIMLSQAAVAQPDAGASCRTCRAMAHFRTCENPQEGAKVIRGKVVGVEQARCSQVLSLEVSRASKQSLPAYLRVDLGSCAFWAGDTGDVIDVAVLETQVNADKVYSLACRLW
jgi:hypothetical protein